MTSPISVETASFDPNCMAFRHDASPASSVTRPFSVRGFASLLISLVTLIVLVSGIVLYLAPRGRVAQWNDWTMLRLSRDQWVALHINMSLLFVGVALLHVSMNLSRLLGYVKRRGRPGLSMKPELLSALAVFGAITAGTLWSLPPINLPVELKYRVRDSWEQRVESSHSSEQNADSSEFAQSVGPVRFDVSELPEATGPISGRRYSPR